MGPRQRTLPTYLPKVDVPRPPPPTYVGAQRPNVRWGGGTYVRAERPNVRWGGGTYVRAERPNVSGNVQRQRGQATSLDTDAHAPHSASELAPGAAAG